jgi:Xaa-Pro aminopeptidase
MKQQLKTPSLFSNNRKRFVKEMLPNSIAVFVSNDEWPSNGDALHPFKQNSDLYWLCGIHQEDTMIVMYPDHPDPAYREVLVLVRPNEFKEKWELTDLSLMSLSGRMGSRAATRGRQGCRPD